jgi:TatD DNase family protein
MWTDTHAHLYLEHFDNDEENIIKRARNSGIGRVYMPNIDTSTIDRMLRLEAMAPDFFRSMIGLHPGSVKQNYRDELKVVFSEIHKHNYAAVGEIGTDLYWDKTFIDQQVSAFEMQIDLAKEHGLPVIIHARDSMDLTIDIVEKKQDGKLTGIFHCFSGNLEQAKKVTDLGFKLGIGGVLTYKNSGLAEVVSKLELKHFVLETDAPYLAPVPYRGKRNESSYIIYIAQKMAEIKNVSFIELMHITNKNVDSVFLF